MRFIDDIINTLSRHHLSCKEKKDLRRFVEQLKLRPGRMVKLQREQKVSARDEIRKLIRAGVSTGDAVRRISDRYGVSSRTIRRAYDERP